MNLSDPQRSVAAHAAAGLGLTFGALLLSALWWPFETPSATMDGRLHLLALAVLAPAITVAFSIARLGNHRFHSPQDLDGSGLTQGTQRAKLLQSLLQNSLEQLVLALPAYLAWALLAPARLVHLILVAALLFVIGRVLFFHGYARGAPGRALGFALTFYPSVVVLVGALIFAAIS